MVTNSCEQVKAAVRTVLARIPPADRVRLRRHGHEWQVYCCSNLADMRRQHVWAMVNCRKHKWLFYVDPQVFSQLSAAAQAGLMAH